MGSGHTDLLYGFGEYDEPPHSGKDDPMARHMSLWPEHRLCAIAPLWPPSDPTHPTTVVRHCSKNLLVVRHQLKLKSRSWYSDCCTQANTLWVTINPHRVVGKLAKPSNVRASERAGCGSPETLRTCDASGGGRHPRQRASSARVPSYLFMGPRYGGPGANTIGSGR